MPVKKEMEPWYYVAISGSAGRLKWYACQFEDTIENSLFSREENEFIRLNNVCWLERNESNGKSSLVKLEENNPNYEDYFYVKKS